MMNKSTYKAKTVINSSFQFIKDIKIKIDSNLASSKVGLESKFFETWNPVLDEVLSALPESDICPHNLFKSLIQNPSPARKRIILVSDQSKPVALLGLRERYGYWEPITQWLVPGVLFPVKGGYLWRVLASVGYPLHVAWWRWESPPEQHPWIKDVISVPTHGMSCSDDFESYWRLSSHFKNIRKARNRCQDFELRINYPGMLEWTVHNWGKRWGGVNGMSDLSDRLLVSQYLHNKGLCNVLSLHDQHKTVAGATMLIHGNEAVAYVNYREQEYDSFGAMNSLIEKCFYWAKEMKLDRFDIGGSQDYKKKWAPEDSFKYEFNVNIGK